MYRFLFRTANTARKSSVSVCESWVSPAKCDKTAASVFRVASGGGIKALSTNSVRLCEKKNNIASSNQDEKTNGDKEAEPTEAASLVTQKAEEVMKMADQSEEESVVLKTDDGSATLHADVKIEKDAATLKQVEVQTAKTGKEGLLELLGTMKVDITNKRKHRNLKIRQSYEPQSPAMESTISMFKKATVEASSQGETLDPKLVAAASAAASTLPDSSQAESQLLRQLRWHEAVTDAQKKGDMNNLGVIIADMRVGRNPKRHKARSNNAIQFDDDGRGYTHDRGITSELDGVRRRKNLFSGRRLNIFSPTTDEDRVESTDAQPTLWDMEFANQLSLSTNQKHRNALEEMIQWTKEGKMWQYPINNEAGLEEEASVPFHEHIFLEKHLEEGFPRQGPVRHFMELVVAGLSRNPYLTVQQKRDHISWFRDYFHQKEEVLKEADVYLN